MIDWLSVLGNRLLGVIRSLRNDDRIIVIQSGILKFLGNWKSKQKEILVLERLKTNFSFN